VYIAGNEVVAGKAVAKFWKNGVVIILGDGIRNSRAMELPLREQMCICVAKYRVALTHLIMQHSGKTGRQLL